MSRLGNQLKRFHVHDGSPSTKRYKIHIEQLDINGLLDVSNQSKVAFDAMYNERYGDKVVCLTMHTMAVDSRPRPLSKKRLQFKVMASFTNDCSAEKKTNSSNPVDGKHLLVNFGHLITKLHINYNTVNEETDDDCWKTIEKLIIEKCSKSLINLVIQCNKGDAFEMLQNSFPSLECLSIEDSVMTEKMLQLAKFTPNVKQLRLDFRGFSMQEQFYSALDTSLDRETTYQTMEFLHAASENMLQLTHLKLFDINLTTSPDMPTINFDNVTNLKLKIRIDDTAQLQAMPLFFTKLNDYIVPLREEISNTMTTIEWNVDVDN